MWGQLFENNFEWEEKNYCLCMTYNPKDPKNAFLEIPGPAPPENS